MKHTLIKWTGIVFLSLTILTIVLPYLIPLPKQETFLPQNVANAAGKFITIDNYTGFYIDKNESSSKAIVFLHGFGSSTASWQHVTDSFNADGYRTIAIDLKGFGMSQKGYAIDYSHKAQADYVVAILTQLSISEATFVGHSMGGNVTAIIASEYPEMVQKIIFVDPALITTKQGMLPWMNVPPFRRLFQHVILRFITKDRLQSFLQSAYYKSTPISEATLTAYTLPLQIKDWELSLLGMVRDSGKNTVDVTKIKKELPVLILWGADDTWVPVNQSNIIKEYFSNEQFVVVEETGHVLQEEKPPEFIRLVSLFLAK